MKNTDLKRNGTMYNSDNVIERDAAVLSFNYQSLYYYHCKVVILLILYYVHDQDFSLLSITLMIYT